MRAEGIWSSREVMESGEATIAPAEDSDQILDRIPELLSNQTERCSLGREQVFFMMLGRLAGEQGS